MTGFSLDLNDGFSGFAAATPADGCTQCGICLPACPTFTQSQDMEQSPMGRIRLIRLLDQGEEVADESLAKLESCLSCYACVSRCPSRVEYGSMLDKALVEVRKRRKLPGLTRMMLWLAKHPVWIRVSLRLAAIFDFTGLRSLGRASGLTSVLGLARADTLIKEISYPQSQLYNRARTDEPARNVAMFTGCFTSVLEQELQQSAVDFLNALGIGVIIPKEQVCCGALHRHNGDSEQAIKLAQTNLKAFNNTQASAIISTSSGCGASLKDYDKWLEDESLALPVMDINHFLAEQLKNRKVVFKNQALKVAVHTPCTLKQGEGQADALNELLQFIPGLEVHHLSGEPYCCGAGGSHMLSHGEMADSLRDAIINEVAELKPDLLLSANLGCAMHLQAGLTKAGLEIPLQHPVQLLSQALTVEFVTVKPAAAG